MTVFLLELISEITTSDFQSQHLTHFFFSDKQSRFKLATMVKFIKPGKVVILLAGRYAGRKALIVKQQDDGSSIADFNRRKHVFRCPGPTVRARARRRYRPIPPKSHQGHGQEAHHQAMPNQALCEGSLRHPSSHSRMRISRI
jgi:hypothetical protein